MPRKQRTSRRIRHPAIAFRQPNCAPSSIAASRVAAIEAVGRLLDLLPEGQVSEAHPNLDRPWNKTAVQTVNQRWSAITKLALVRSRT